MALEAIPGLYLFNEWCTVAEEEELARGDAWDETDPSISRRVRHFGARFDYASLSSAAGDTCVPISGLLLELCKRVATVPCDCGGDDAPSGSCVVSEGGFSRCAQPDQVTLNEYLPGQGISCHCDTHSPFGDVICSLSLCSGVRRGLLLL